MAVKHFLYFKSILVSSTSPPFPQLQLRVALHLLIILISVAPCPMRFFPLPVRPLPRLRPSGWRRAEQPPGLS